MAVLCPSQRTTGSAPSTAAAPQEYRAAHHDGVGHNGGQANGGHVGESEAETVEHNARAEYLLCAELNARHPCFGQLVAQTVGIKHSEYDSHYQGREGKAFDERHFGKVECRERKQCDEQYPVQGVCPRSFFKHSNVCYLLIRIAKVAICAQISSVSNAECALRQRFLPTFVFTDSQTGRIKQHYMVSLKPAG